MDVSTNIAEVVGAVFWCFESRFGCVDSGVRCANQSSQERIDEITDALKAGGKEARNFSVEQLEIEEARQADIERQRASGVEKLQAYTIAQIALNGAIAIARTFAEYPFPVSLGIAALQGGDLCLYFGYSFASPSGQKPKKVLGDINSQSLTDSRGVIKGKRHCRAGCWLKPKGNDPFPQAYIHP